MCKFWPISNWQEYCSGTFGPKAGTRQIVQGGLNSTKAEHPILGPPRPSWLCLGIVGGAASCRASWLLLPWEPCVWRLPKTVSSWHGCLAQHSAPRALCSKGLSPFFSQANAQLAQGASNCTIITQLFSENIGVSVPPSSAPWRCPWLSPGTTHGNVPLLLMNSPIRETLQEVIGKSESIVPKAVVPLLGVSEEHVSR